MSENPYDWGHDVEEALVKGVLTGGVVLGGLTPEEPDTDEEPDADEETP